MFELQTHPVPELAELGERVELREQSYGDMRRAIVAGGARGTESLLCATLFVDGEPYTLAELDALPGRFGGPITRAVNSVVAMYRLEAPTDEDEKADAGGDAPQGKP